ncbi:phospholipase D-like domain-containing protein [Aeromicrobium wangtongii]|uniref:phospholipase D-like domain-containing protein n=1 Tax=Aeromicrobium wangtongii TaxID=2969247 RepID=UPI0020174CEA|nr:phospholipase D-like domain-containing protein [Aeromicrobium wangtongii]MCL3818555.1 phospholipase D-like domain-containing protein [Aeromicrobium wangtongii]
MAVLAGSVVLGLTSVASNAADVPSTPASSPTPETPAVTSGTPEASVKAQAAPYGDQYPVTLEANFSRPYRAVTSSKNGDFTLLDDLERLIRGSYRDPKSGKQLPKATRYANTVFVATSQMPGSKRVGRELVKAAKAGVRVRFIHGRATQSPSSRALKRALNAKGLRDSHFKICAKGKSLACLSGLNGAIMHSKLVMVSNTYTRDNKPARGAVWTGSANLGGRSAEQTYNNGLTVYNDAKLWAQMSQLWKDMSAERNIGNDYLGYVKKNAGKYGYATADARAAGYTEGVAKHGMFYSNLANVTIYPTPIRATPTNGKDPVLNLLKRVVPDDQCRIRLQHNRFKYRRIAIAEKLVELSNGGCKISAVAYEDNLKVNQKLHCQQLIRICRPILDVLKTSSQRIEVAWAKPHDKTMLIDAKLRRNTLNPEEVAPDGTTNWPADGVRVKLVQAGSASLTGSNLVVSDEITTETTDPSIYEDYLEHWKAILKSHEYKAYPY